MEKIVPVVCFLISRCATYASSKLGSSLTTTILLDLRLTLSMASINQVTDKSPAEKEVIVGTVAVPDGIGATPDEPPRQEGSPSASADALVEEGLSALLSMEITDNKHGHVKFNWLQHFVLWLAISYHLLTLCWSPARKTLL